ncbi:B3 domain-containing transcription factor ABI3-like isoform X2 [Salvia hispanica]|uniref:B3 domain-containing transcription factor ABI3-like isoform X2 n=1 Tax=Salvia hispanica TaxID=49212 RepID=UPI0020093F03|nr:B3 domain-containing transcription factor ABI3-like isoform X2 [Salvia hispanica]
MVKVAAAEQDLHFSCAGDEAEEVGGGGGVENANPIGFEEDRIDDKEMWLDRDQDGLFGVNEASIFYDDFPSLPEFPCTSSCSSSSSSSSSMQPEPEPEPKPVTGSSSPSSATSWVDEDGIARICFQDQVKMDACLGNVDCIDVMENLEYMDLIECNELWDPSSVYSPQEDQQAVAQPPEEDSCGLSFLQGNSELAMIFFEWLKQNKDHISAEDMRSIKLKRSTVESASKRLGTTKEGKKQLLKLILDWVEQYQLHKKAQSPSHPNPSFIYNPHPNTTQWMQPEVDPMHGVVNGIPCQYPQVIEQAPSWSLSQSLYGNPYVMHGSNGERSMRLGSSATREARKMRMARQQRSLYSHQSHRLNQLQNRLNDPRLGDDGASPGDLGYWSLDASSRMAAATQPNSNRQPQRQAAAAVSASNRQQQQGWKTEKNLKCLLQKVLKQSDVGNLGRIVLPKKEAESHLPELETRDGISIAMEDIGTSRVWNMRYRMYLLENTGDFVRVNELQEGDFIVIYSDTKCGKYMIRGVKVQQPGGKLEAKKPARRNIRSLSSLAGNSSSLAPIRQTVR